MADRKRRKWDVAAPQGIPLRGNRAGIGSSSSSTPSAPAGGLITAQGLQSLPSPAQQAASPLTTPSPGAPAKPAGPLDRDTIARAQLGAAAIVAKLNQELAAQGKLPPGKVISFAKPGEDQVATVFRDVYINDAPPEMRHHMTKRPTQDDVARRTGTQVVTRGRYMAPGTPFTDVDKPLHLHITPGACSSEDEAEQRRCIEMAASQLRLVLEGQRPPRGSIYQPPSKLGAGGPPQGFQQLGAPPINPYSAPPPGVSTGPSGLGGQPPGSYLQAPYGQQLQQPAAPAIPGVQSTSLYLGFEAAPDFNVAQRLKGPNGSYMQHIATETGANITLRGKGSGIQESDALHIYISSGIPKNFSEAAKLAQNLIDTVKSEHDKQFPYYQPPPAARPPFYAPPPGQPMQRPAYPPASYPPPGGPMQYPPPAAPGQMPGGPYRPPPGSGAPYQGSSYGPPLQRPPYPQGPQQYGPPPSAPGNFAPPPQQPYPPPQAYPPPDRAASQPGGPPGGPAGAESALPGETAAQQEQRRRRFREFKEEKPVSAVLQPPPYYAPPPDFQQPQQQPVQHMHMGPPQAPMGPPPPKFNGGFGMAPPPPRQPQNAAGVTPGSAAAGGLGGLVDYGDDD